MQLTAKRNCREWNEIGTYTIQEKHDPDLRILDKELSVHKLEWSYYIKYIPCEFEYKSM